jgi:hypothetical protein
MVLASGSKVTIFDWDDTKLCEKSHPWTENDGKLMIVGHIWKTGFILENDG